MKKRLSLHNRVHLWRTATSVVLLIVSVCEAHAAGNAVRGRTVFKQCQVCHSVTKNVNKEGPSLYGVINRPASGVANYFYSDAMKASAKKGLIWTADNVIKYLADPHKFFADYLGDPLVHNKMIFMLVNRRDREDVVSYLQSLPAN